MCTPSSVSKAFLERRVTATRCRLKRVGAITQPCFTPIVTLKGAEISPHTRIFAVIPSWNCQIIARKFWGHPNFWRTFQSKSRLMVFNALRRSMNENDISFWCSFTFTEVVKQQRVYQLYYVQIGSQLKIPGEFCQWDDGANDRAWCGKDITGDIKRWDTTAVPQSGLSPFFL